MLGHFQPLEARRAAEGKIQLVVVHHVEHHHVVPALPQQLQPFDQPGPVDEQVGDEDHHPAARIALGHVAQDREQVGLVSRLADVERLDDRVQMVPLACAAARSARIASSNATQPTASCCRSSR